MRHLSLSVATTPLGKTPELGTALAIGLRTLPLPGRAHYAVFVIELHSRRVQVIGSTRYPDEAFVLQARRHLTDGVDGVVGPGRLLICDRDPKWSRAVVSFLEGEGIQVIRTLVQAPNCNAYAERFLRSIKEECLDRVLLLVSWKRNY